MNEVEKKYKKIINSLLVLGVVGVINAVTRGLLGSGGGSDDLGIVGFLVGYPFGMLFGVSVYVAVWMIVDGIFSMITPLCFIFAFVFYRKYKGYLNRSSK